jgi:hypothetical protein
MAKCINDCKLWIGAGGILTSIWHLQLITMQGADTRKDIGRSLPSCGSRTGAAFSTACDSWAEKAKSEEAFRESVSARSRSEAP